MGRQSQRDEADGLLDRVARRRFLRYAAARLRRDAPGLGAARAAAIEELPPAARRALFLDPAFGRLAAAPTDAGLALAGHSTTIPLVAAGRHPKAAFRLKADGRGRVLFAGHPVALELGAAAAGRVVEVRWTGAALKLPGAEVAGEELLAGPSSRRSLARRREPLPGVECGAGTPFFAQAAAATLEGRWRARARPGDAARRLAGALALLKAAWPERHAAVRAHVRQFALSAPGGFEGSTRGLLGAVFFSSGATWFRSKVRPADGRGSWPDAAWQDVEFLLHEAAHQELFALDELHPLWTDREPGRRLRSPWTGVPRPAGVLGAGLHAYVATLDGLRRLDASGLVPAARRRALAARLDALRAGFAEGFAVARAGLELTPRGARLLDGLAARARALS